jgi:two-component system, LytTR family, response regulator
MRAAIIDNEAPVRNTLKAMINVYCSSIVEIQEAAGVDTGFQLVSSYKPDLVFLDMEMDDGTGVDLLKRLGEYNFQLIFITAHEKYALDAIKMSAIDFLLKPIVVEDLINCVKKASANLKNLDLQKQIQVLKDSLVSLKSNDEKIVLKDSESIHFVRLNDIVYCDADGPYTTFYLVNNEKIIISKTLKDFDELLETKGFFRTHKSYLVNISKIIRFNRAEGGVLIMENGMEVPVSQRKRDEVMGILQA